MMAPGITDPTQPFAPMPNGGAEAGASLELTALVIGVYLAVTFGSMWYLTPQREGLL